MGQSKFAKETEKLAETIVSAYNKIQRSAVGGYQKVESTVVGGYTQIEDAFVNRYLLRDGESVEEAKRRLKGN